MKKNTPRILLQLSDIHVVPDVGKNSSWAEVGDAFHLVGRWLGGLSTQPDAMIITGDLVDDGRLESYACLKSMLQEFDLPIYVIPGNHDNREHLKKSCPEYMGNALSEGDGFIQYAVNVAGVRLVALDTLETGQHYGVLCDKRLEWLADTLAKDLNTPTIIAMHHPPFKTGMIFMDKVRLLQGADRLESIILQNKQVKRIICGHQHRASTQCFANTLAIVAASASHQLTPQLTKDEPLGYTHERPSLFMHIWNDDDLCIASHMLGIVGTMNKILFNQPLP
ncbi:MAG: metallophosphoesterase [Saezia sp.]